MQDSNIPAIISEFDKLPVAQCRVMFDKLQEELFKLPQLQDTDYQLEEYYSGGMYVRKITIPAGALITGRIYKFDHIEMQISGDITIVSADGGTKRYTGHNVIEASAGKRQAGFAHTETVWLTVNQTPEMESERMLDYTSVLSYREFEQFHAEVNRIDFVYFLKEIGMTQEEVDAIANIPDVVDMPEEFSHIYTDTSLIAGIGLFSSKQILKGVIICPVRIGENRTIAGRYSNHALHPVSEPYVVDGAFYITAKKDIHPGEEITMSYREVVNFRRAQGDTT